MEKFVQKRASTGVLLIQLGTPDSPGFFDVRRYLSEFLNDPRVIDLPWLLRKFLVNVVIVPFRTSGSSKIYKQLWADKGSPIIIYGDKVRDLLQQELGDDYKVEIAMRYQNPSLEEVTERMRKANYKKIIVLPLFPQYASASTGSAMEKAIKLISNWWVIPELSVISQYYDNPGYINAFAEIGKKYPHQNYDHVLFSFHGLPVRQVDKVYTDGKPCDDHDCENEITEDNKYCYKAVCYATARMITGKLGIPKEKYTVCFQSRLDKDWLEPFADKMVIEQAKKGAKNLLVFSPAFVADCLETLIEIGHEYDVLFKEHGGEKVQLVESLNDHPLWISTLADLVKTRQGGS